LILTFGDKIKLSEHFEIPLDETPWQGLYKDTTPARELATFETFTRALNPRQEYRDFYDNAFGVYILILSIPCPAFYVGIASGESILNRIRKHRVKVTGSHVGNGVNHTKEWRLFAQKRAQYFSNHNSTDSCEDAFLLVGTLDNNETCDDRCALEYFENALVNNKNGITEKIVGCVMSQIFETRKIEFNNIRNLNMPSCWAEEENKNLVWNGIEHGC
jgi:hypothetical protein